METEQSGQKKSIGTVPNSQFKSMATFFSPSIVVHRLCRTADGLAVTSLNEEETLASIMREIPRLIQGGDEVKILVVDDGSTDRTAEVAAGDGTDYVVKLPYTQGLAKAFSAGINECLEHGADVIVNTDDDNQIPAEISQGLSNPFWRAGWRP